MNQIKGTNRSGTLTVPASFLREIDVGTWQGVSITLDGDQIIITKARCKCGGDTYLSKQNTVCCDGCREPIESAPPTK